MLAKHALYQLSYGPSGAPSGQAMGRGDLVGQRRLGNASRRGRVVGPGGLEPPTSRLSGVCSNQLSYRPKAIGARDRIQSLRPAPYGSGGFG